MPSKNEAALTLTRDQAVAAGVLSSVQAVEHITANSRKQYGFTRKQVPEGLPTEPKLYIYSVSEYGDQVNLGPGFKLYTVPACPEKDDYGEPCVIDPINFFEEAKVDVTEHTFTSGPQIANAILRVGPGMNAAWDRRKVGWFVSNTNPPTEKEVKAAVDIYTEECKKLLAAGNRYASANQLNEINEQHRRAAKYLKQKVDWDKPLQKMVDCPGCQEPVRANAIIHAVPYCGYVFNWKGAIESSMRKLSDAPPHMQKALAKELGIAQE